MLALITAGETVFFLPFVLPRVFRPAILDIFGITNFQLGVAFSVYGVVAMLAYFPGGPLADRFAPRQLMSAALVATGLGGLVLISIPSLQTLKLLYGFWGVTTILLFWAPLIRATRQWGGNQLPGRAFGMLDGGRGLVAALISTLSVALFAWFMPADVESATLPQRAAALRQVIIGFTITTFAVSILVWFGLPDNHPGRDTNDQSAPGTATPTKKSHFKQIADILRMPTVWLQAIIVLCAYVGYKGLDDVSLYAHEALGFNEVNAAKTSTVSMWVRPFAAVAAGLIADRFGVAKSTTVSFLCLLVGCLVIALGLLRPGMMVAFFVTLIGTSAALFALRGLYYAIMEEGHVPVAGTGTAVGIVSVVGYTPEIFMGPLMGTLLDASPGALGHQHLFAVMALFAAIGLVASSVFSFVARRSESADQSPHVNR